MNKLFTLSNLSKSVFICFLLFVLNSISAQTDKFQFGVRGGLNLSTAFVNNASAIKFRLGYHIGGTVDYLFAPKFALQSGLFLSMQGSTIDNMNSGSLTGRNPDWTHTFNQLYLQIPVYVAFRTNIANDLNISIGLGPYLGYGIGGTTKMKQKSGVYSDGSTTKEWDTFGNGGYDENGYWVKSANLKPFDFGAGIKLDLGYKKIIFGIGLETGFINIMNRQNNKDLEYENVNFRLSAGYRF